MADDSTPEGTVEQEAAAPDADALLDRYFGDSDEEHTPEDEEELAEQASEEDADTDPAAEEADKEDDAAKEGEDQSQEAGRFVADDGKVRLTDGTVTTVAELKRGSLREADYTRKTQEISALRTELDTRQAALTQYEQSINFAIEVAQSYFPAEPDPSIIQEDPVGGPAVYLQQKAVFDGRLAQLQQLYAAKQQAEQQRTAQQQAELQKQMQKGAEILLDAMPELKQPDKLNAFTTDLGKAVTKYGFDPQDISLVKDYRLFLLAKDAMAYQKLMASKPTAVAKTKGKPPLAPGRRQSPDGDKSRQRHSDWQKLRQSHGRDNEALDRILDDLI